MPDDSRRPPATVTVEVDGELLDRARALGVDPAGLLRDGLSRAVRDAETRAPREPSTDEVVDALNEFHAKHGSLADFHRRV
jgi:post-segregation antitoxin (ccd killing protein)